MSLQWQGAQRLLMLMVLYTADVYIGYICRLVQCTELAYNQLGGILKHDVAFMCSASTQDIVRTYVNIVLALAPYTCICVV